MFVFTVSKIKVKPLFHNWVVLPSLNGFAKTIMTH